MYLSRFFGAVFAYLAAATTAYGSVVYTYTGDNFDTILNRSIYNSSMRVTGSLILSEALAPNLFSAAVLPTSFTFSDGVTGFTESNTDSGLFMFSTDSSGNIVEWNIDLRIGFPSPVSVGNVAAGLVSTSDVFTQPDGGIIQFCAAVTGGTCTFVGTSDASLSSTPGTWTVSAVPLPAAIYLFGSGLLGLIGIAKRRTPV